MFRCRCNILLLCFTGSYITCAFAAVRMNTVCSYVELIMKHLCFAQFFLNVIDIYIFYCTDASSLNCTLCHVSLSKYGYSSLNKVVLDSRHYYTNL